VGAARSTWATRSVGDPADARTQVGPLISRAASDRVAVAVDAARSAGAHIHTAGLPHGLPPRGAYHPPTVISRAPAGADVLTEEEAVRLANATEYGLAASVSAAGSSQGSVVLRSQQGGGTPCQRCTARHSARTSEKAGLPGDVTQGQPGAARQVLAPLAGSVPSGLLDEARHVGQALTAA
jgi:hypothetical protein